VSAYSFVSKVFDNKPGAMSWLGLSLTEVGLKLVMEVSYIFILIVVFLRNSKRSLLTFFSVLCVFKIAAISAMVTQLTVCASDQVLFEDTS